MNNSGLNNPNEKKSVETFQSTENHESIDFNTAESNKIEASSAELHTPADFSVKLNSKFLEKLAKIVEEQSSLYDPNSSLEQFTSQIINRFLDENKDNLSSEFFKSNGWTNFEKSIPLCFLRNEVNQTSSARKSLVSIFKAIKNPIEDRIKVDHVLDEIPLQYPNKDAESNIQFYKVDSNHSNDSIFQNQLCVESNFDIKNILTDAIENNSKNATGISNFLEKPESKIILKMIKNQGLRWVRFKAHLDILADAKKTDFTQNQATKDYINNVLTLFSDEFQSYLQKATNSSPNNSDSKISNFNRLSMLEKLPFRLDSEYIFGSEQQHVHGLSFSFNGFNNPSSKFSDILNDFAENINAVENNQKILIKPDEAFKENVFDFFKGLMVKITDPTKKDKENGIFTSQKDLDKLLIYIVILLNNEFGLNQIRKILSVLKERFNFTQYIQDDLNKLSQELQDKQYPLAPIVELYAILICGINNYCLYFFDIFSYLIKSIAESILNTESIVYQNFQNIGQDLKQLAFEKQGLSQNLYNNQKHSKNYYISIDDSIFLEDNIKKILKWDITVKHESWNQRYEQLNLFLKVYSEDEYHQQDHDNFLCSLMYSTTLSTEHYSEIQNFKYIIQNTDNNLLNIAETEKRYSLVFNSSDQHSPIDFKNQKPNKSEFLNLKDIIQQCNYLQKNCDEKHAIHLLLSTLFSVYFYKLLRFLYINNNYQQVHINLLHVESCKSFDKISNKKYYYEFDEYLFYPLFHGMGSGISFKYGTLNTQTIVLNKIDSNKMQMSLADSKVKFPKKFNFNNVANATQIIIAFDSVKLNPMDLNLSDSENTNPEEKPNKYNNGIIGEIWVIDRDSVRFDSNIVFHVDRVKDINNLQNDVLYPRFKDELNQLFKNLDDKYHPQRFFLINGVYQTEQIHDFESRDKLKFLNQQFTNDLEEQFLKKTYPLYYHTSKINADKLENDIIIPRREDVFKSELKSSYLPLWSFISPAEVNNKNVKYHSRIDYLIAKDNPVSKVEDYKDKHMFLETLQAFSLLHVRTFCKEDQKYKHFKVNPYEQVFNNNGEKTIFSKSAMPIHWIEKNPRQEVKLNTAFFSRDIFNILEGNL